VGELFNAIKRQLQTTAPTTIRWKQRFRQYGLEGLDTYHRQPKRHFQKAVSYVFLMLFTAGLSSSVFSQELTPFQVSNPKHKKWSSDEAGKIYYSACELLARTVRPEKPPRPHPRFLLVLGANDDQVLRTDTGVEIHLKSWDADKFAEAMVMVAAREVLQRDDLTKIARQSVSVAQSTVSVERLESNR
jgi:hypothetical protein